MILRGIIALRDRKQHVTPEDVGELVAETCLKTQAGERDPLRREMEKLLTDIETAKREIFAMSVNDKAENAIVDASQHLDEVIQATEQATHTIMDAADGIQMAAGGLSGPEGQAIMDATMRIYDACTFQDISGQRITKVIRLLENIESRLSSLNDLFGIEAAAGEAQKEAYAHDLLSGPQLKSEAASQDDIDALFASLNKN